MKRCRREWKRVGPPPRAEADALWQRFRDRLRSLLRPAAAGATSWRGGGAGGRRRRSATSSTRSPGRSGGRGAVRRGRRGRPSTRRGPSGSVSTSRTLDDARPLAERLHAACERIAAARPESLRGHAARSRDDATSGARSSARAGGAGAAERHRRRSRSRCRRWRWRCASGSPPTRSRGASAATGPKQDVGARSSGSRASWAHLGPALDDDARALAERFERARDRVRAARG